MSHLKVDQPAPNVRIIQPQKGYRFGMDALSLAAFVIQQGAKGPVLDIGTGVGIIAVLVARAGIVPVKAIEVQDELFEYAQQNVQLNQLEEVLEVIHGDFKENRRIFRQSSFSTIVCNPPFYPVNSGRHSPLSTKAMAKHEVLITLDDIMKGIHYLLTAKGTAYLIYPAGGLLRFTKVVSSNRLGMSMIRFLYPEGRKQAVLFIAGLTQNPNSETIVLEPWVIPTTGTRLPEQVQKTLARL